MLSHRGKWPSKFPEQNKGFLGCSFLPYHRFRSALRASQTTPKPITASSLSPSEQHFNAAVSNETGWEEEFQITLGSEVRFYKKGCFHQFILRLRGRQKNKTTSGKCYRFSGNEGLALG